MSFVTGSRTRILSAEQVATWGRTGGGQVSHRAAYNAGELWPGVCMKESHRVLVHFITSVVIINELMDGLLFRAKRTRYYLTE